MKQLILILPLLLTACATPSTYMTNKQGEIKECGGGVMASVLFGRIGYEIQKERDKACVEEMKAKGYK